MRAYTRQQGVGMSFFKSVLDPGGNPSSEWQCAEASQRLTKAAIFVIVLYQLGTVNRKTWDSIVYNIDPVIMGPLSSSTSSLASSLFA